MEWKEAFLELQKGNVIHLSGGVNYLYLLKPNHYLIYTPGNKSIYRISITQYIKNINTWEIDNRYKQEIEEIIKREVK